MKKNLRKWIGIEIAVLLFVSLPSCRTTGLDVTPQTAREKPLTAKDKKAEKKRAEQEKKDAAKKAQEARIEEELKEVDVEKTVIYIDRPVYSPIEQPPKTVEGTEAIEESQKAAAQVPMKFVNGIMYCPYDETFVYEIHCRPYRTTDIMLEPGEVVIEMPFMSEDRVREAGAGVSRKDGQDVQHFFVKPSRQGARGRYDHYHRPARVPLDFEIIQGTVYGYGALGISRYPAVPPRASFPAGRRTVRRQPCAAVSGQGGAKRSSEFAQAGRLAG